MKLTENFQSKENKSSLEGKSSTCIWKHKERAMRRIHDNLHVLHFRFAQSKCVFAFVKSKVRNIAFCSCSKFASGAHTKSSFLSHTISFVFPSKQSTFSIYLLAPNNGWFDIVLFAFFCISSALRWNFVCFSSAFSNSCGFLLDADDDGGGSVGVEIKSIWRPGNLHMCIWASKEKWRKFSLVLTLIRFHLNFKIFFFFFSSRKGKKGAEKHTMRGQSKQFEKSPCLAGEITRHDEDIKTNFFCFPWALSSPCIFEDSFIFSRKWEFSNLECGIFADGGVELMWHNIIILNNLWPGATFPCVSLENFYFIFLTWANDNLKGLLATRKLLRRNCFASLEEILKNKSVAKLPINPRPFHLKMQKSRSSHFMPTLSLRIRESESKTKRRRHNNKKSYCVRR